MASSSSSALMPSSSSSSSSPPPSSSQRVSHDGEWQYDVFLCFRGEDIRSGFVSHVSGALSDKLINFFIDRKLKKSESIDQLISILEKSALSVVIFSANFADSKWCLNEVDTIARRMRESGHRVLPVFYKVDPDDVEKDSGSFAATIEQAHGASSDTEKRKEWKDGLKAVANQAGLNSQDYPNENELVEAIVNNVREILDEMSTREKPDILIGMDARLSDIHQLLISGNDDDFRVIGLWGMGGVGKSTLANECYRLSVSSRKEMKHHFVSNVNQRKLEIEEIVRELYSVLLSEDNLRYQNLDVSTRKDRLSRLKVFLVLDNVETIPQLELLLLRNILKTETLFAPGSRIILTSRDRKVLVHAKACVYEVNCLLPKESLQLFSLHAFRESSPPNDWQKLSDDAVIYSRGNPLAIKVMGSALFSEDKSYWESFLGAFGNTPKPEIHHVLKRSYDMLENFEKQAFLDIACFLGGNRKSVLTSYFSPTEHVVENLINKSLVISVLHENLDEMSIQVHDLLREMAWNIVNDEPRLEKRSRLQNPDDIHKLLRIRKVKRTVWSNIFKGKEKHNSAAFEGSRGAIEGIKLDISEANTIYLEANAFEGTNSLRYLSFTNSRNESGASKVHVLPKSGLVTLPDSLKCLEWEGFPLKSLSSAFSPANLVILAMRHSRTIKRCWEVQAQLVNLIWLDLSHCINLVALPDLSMSQKLERLFLRGCKRLTELPAHVRDLPKLSALDLDDCTNLRSVPTKLNSKLLKHVWLSKCPKVTGCPEIASRTLSYLDLRETPVKTFPSAVHRVKQDGILHLWGEHIAVFPAISASLSQLHLCRTTINEMGCYDHDDHQGSLPRFARLELVDNPELKSLSRNIWNIVSGTLNLEGCPSIETLPKISPQPVSGLTELRIYVCGNLRSLPSGMENLKLLQTLIVGGTNVASLPAGIEELDRLSFLNLPFNERLEFVPSGIHKLAKLSHLCLMGCPRIQSLPELPLNLLTLDVSGCKSLQALPSNMGRLRWRDLHFADCPRLDMNMPEEMVHDFPNYATSCLHPQVALQYSRSKIPNWFVYKCTKYTNVSSMVVQLSPPILSTTDRPIKGIAFGAVCSPVIGIVGMYITCDCIIDSTVVASWSSPGFGLGLTPSDNVYIWHEKNLLGESKEGMRKEEEEEEEEPWYERHAAGLAVSFRFYPQVIYPKRFQSAMIKIRRVGVSLLS